MTQNKSKDVERFKLLARAYDRMIGGEGDPPLFDEIVAFLRESKPKETTANG